MPEQDHVITVSAAFFCCNSTITLLTTIVSAHKASLTCHKNVITTLLHISSILHRHEEIINNNIAHVHNKQNSYIGSSTIHMYIKTKHVVATEVVLEFNSCKSYVFPLYISDALFVNKLTTLCTLMDNRHCFQYLWWFHGKNGVC